MTIFVFRTEEDKMPSLKKIVVQNFRNIAFQELSFSPNINCISGNNGEGKTNLMDAVWYLSMTKSAFASSDRFNFRHGTDTFAVSGTYSMNMGPDARFSVQVDGKGKKKGPEGRQGIFEDLRAHRGTADSDGLTVRYFPRQRER